MKKIKLDLYLDEDLDFYFDFKRKVNYNFNKIRNLFFDLLERFGRQGWWPTYYTNGINEKIEILIGTVLTQNTSWKQVEKSLSNLAKYNLVNLNLLEKIKKEKELVLELIRPSGFAKRKIETLKDVLIWFKNNVNREKNIRELRKELLSIKGVGKETADSIILYVFNKPIFVIDKYTKDFFFKKFGEKIKNYDLLRLIFESAFLDEDNKTWVFKEYHALIVEYGKREK